MGKGLLHSGRFNFLGDMLRHIHGLYSQRPYFLTNQRGRIRLVIVKIKIEK